MPDVPMIIGKIILSCALLLMTIAGAAQQKKNAGKKKSVKVVAAHRGTVVLNIHEKVGRQAQTRYAALPKLGSLLNTLPAGAVVVLKDSTSYYYKNGFFYLPVANRYQLVLPPAGIRIPGLPIGYRRTPVAEKMYFYYYGTFYAQAGSSDKYDVVAPPEGAVVDALPDGYKVSIVDKTEYYLLGDVYYAEVDDAKMETKTGYEVVTIIQAYQSN